MTSTPPPLDPDSLEPTAWPYTGTLEPESRSGVSTLGVALLVMLVALVLFVFTMAPSVGWGSDALRQLQAPNLRVEGGAGDHPLFTAAAHGVWRLPIERSDAYRVTLTAVFCGALTVLLVFLITLRLLDRAQLGGSPRSRLWFAAAGALTLAVSHSFWVRAATPAPAALSAFLFTMIVWLWARRMTGGGAGNILLGAFLAGLALAADIGAALYAPVFLISGLWLLYRPPAIDTDPGDPDSQFQGAAGGRRRRLSLLGAITSLLLMFGIGLLPLLAVEVAELVRTPLRAEFETEILPGHRGPVVASVASVARQMVTGRLWPPLESGSFGSRLADFGALHVYNFLLFGTLLGAAGALVLFVRRRVFGLHLLLVALFAIAVAAAVRLPAGDRAGALLPAWIIFAVWIGVGAGVVVRRAAPLALAVLSVLLIGSPLCAYLVAPRLAGERPAIAQLAGLVGPDTGPADPAARLRPWRRGFTQPRDFGNAVLTAVPERGVLLVRESSDRPITATLRYLQRIEGIGRGVRIESIGLEESVNLPRAIAQLTAFDPALRPIFLATADTLDLELAAVASRVRDVPHGHLYVLSGEETLDPGTTGDAFWSDQAEPGYPDTGEPRTTGEFPDTTGDVPGTTGGVPDTTGDVSDTTVAPLVRPMFPSFPATRDTGRVGPDESLERDDRTQSPSPASARLPRRPAAGSRDERTLAEADSLFAAGAHWQAAAAYGSVLTGDDPPPAVDDEVYARYAAALARSGMPVMSEQMRRRYRRSTADTLAARTHLAALLVEVGEGKAALDELGPLLVASPGDARVQLLAGQALFAIGQFDSAQVHLEKAATIAPGHPETLYHLGRAQEEAGAVDAAVETYRRYVALGGGKHTADVVDRLHSLTGAPEER